MLSLVIAAAIIVVSIQFYAVLRRDQDLRQLQYNVDMLFEAASLYYMAQCSNIWTPTGGPQTIAGTGALDPSNVVLYSSFYSPIAISTLQNSGYLTATLPVSPLVNNAGVSNGYIVQFYNPPPTQRIITNGNNVGTTNIGTVYRFRIQVSVELNPNISASAAQYASMLGADCTSSYNAGSQFVYNCGAALPGPYMAFLRAPSYSTQKSQSDLWVINPMLQQFKQSITSSSINYLTQTGGSNQYFLCGG